MVSSHGLVMKFENLHRSAMAWNTLFNQTPSASPFTCYDWFHALCEHLLKVDPEVMIFSENDRPVGIIPAIIDHGTLRLIADERVTDIGDILYLPGYEHRIIEKLASFISDRDIAINLFPLEKQHPLVFFLPEFIDNVIIEEADVCPILNLPESWEDYLKSLNGKTRHELRRKLRKADGVTMQPIGPESIDILFRLMVASDKNKKDFLTAEMCAFFKNVAQLFSHHNWLRFRVARLDSRPIGVLFSFQFRDRIYLYNAGFDPNFSHLSPGIVAIGLDIKAAINERFKYYDFLRGEENYKRQFGAQKRSTLRIMR
jgi:hypothetical protein